MRKRSLLVVILLALLIASAPNAYAYNGGGSGTIDEVKYDNGLMSVNTTENESSDEQSLEVVATDNSEEKAEEKKEEKKEKDKSTQEESKPEVYTVVKGDWLLKICSRYGCTLDELLAINKIDDPNLIYPGQKINIPTKKEETNDEKIESGETTQPSGNGTKEEEIKDETPESIIVETDRTHSSISEDEAMTIYDKDYPIKVISQQLSKHIGSGVVLKSSEMRRHKDLGLEYILRYEDGSLLNIMVLTDGTVHYSATSAPGQKITESMAFIDRDAKDAAKPASLGYDEQFKSEEKEEEKEVAESETSNKIYDEWLNESGIPDVRNVGALQYTAAVDTLLDMFNVDGGESTGIPLVDAIWGLAEGGLVGAGKKLVDGQQKIGNALKVAMNSVTGCNLYNFEKQLYSSLEQFSKSVDKSNKTGSQLLKMYYEANRDGSQLQAEVSFTKVNKYWENMQSLLKSAYEKASDAKKKMSNYNDSLSEAEKKYKEAKSKYEETAKSADKHAYEEAEKAYNKLKDESGDYQKLVDDWNKVQKVFKYKTQL